MDEAIKKQTSLYFSNFYKHTQKWNTIIEKSQKPLSGLKNQVEQLCCIEIANVAKEFCDFPDLKSHLLAKVLAGIDEELFILRSIVNELNMAVQELRNRLVAFEKTTVNIDWDDEISISGNALQPSLSDLLGMALLAWRIYNDLYQNIANSIKSLDIRNDKSLNQINFAVTESDLTIINEIVAITQYCY